MAGEIVRNVILISAREAERVQAAGLLFEWIGRQFIK
jgi:hypothetical protein